MVTNSVLSFPTWDIGSDMGLNCAISEEFSYLNFKEILLFRLKVCSDVCSVSNIIKTFFFEVRSHGLVNGMVQKEQKLSHLSVDPH